MNNELLASAKNVYNELIDFFSNPELRIAMVKAMPDMDCDPDDILTLDALQFMVKVSNADGIISQREVNVINYLTGCYFTVEKLQELAKSGYYSDNCDVPFSIFFLCQVENVLLRNTSLSVSILSLTIKFFELLGNLVADADGYRSTNEHAVIKENITKIKNFASENTHSPFYDYD